MFQFVNITHSDTDPGLDPVDISTTPNAPSFPIHPNNEQHPQTQVPYNVHPPLELPLVNSDSNNQSNKLDSQHLPNPVNAIFPNPDSHNAPSQHRSIDHVINQPNNHLNHSSLSPHHTDPNLQSNQESEPHLPSHFHRSSDKPPPHQGHSVPLPLTLPPPPRQPHHVTHSQSQPAQSHWAMPLPIAPPLPIPHHSNPVSRLRSQLPSDQVYYSTPAAPHASASHFQTPNPITGDTYRPSNVRPYRATTSGQREINPHPHRSPRKRQKRSFVWNYFEESEDDPNVAFCNICKLPIPRGRNLARNTTNLRKHLEHRHPEANKNQTPHVPLQRSCQPSHTSVPPPPPQSRPETDDVTSGPRNRSPYTFPYTHALPSHRTPTDDRILSLQSQAAPQMSIPQDRTAFSLSPATIYQGGTYEGKPEQHFRQRQSLDESSALVHQPMRRPSPSSNPTQMNHIPLPNLQNSQPQGGSQLHLPDLADSGPNARSKEPHSWDPKSLRPPKRFFPEGDDGEEAISYGSRQLASQEQSAALLKFLAVAGLPLSTAKSRTLLELLDVTNNRPYFPDIEELKDVVLRKKMTTLRLEIRNALSSADVIVATIEKRNKTRLLVCHYFAESFKFRSVCLDVIHPAEVKDGFEFGKKAVAAETLTFLQSRRELMNSPNAVRIRKILQRVSNTFHYWKITHKVNAVIVAEKGITADNSHFLPEPLISETESIPFPGFRDLQDTPSKSTRRPTSDSDQGIGSIYDQGADSGTTPNNRIPVLSCLVNTIERIITETICQSDLIAREFIEPLSRGMFKALTDREFLLSEASQAWSDDLKLPINNPSPWELRRLISFYHLHMEAVQLAVKRVDPKDFSFQCVIKGDISFLHSLLETFASSVQNIEPLTCKDRGSKRERTSAALPLMRDLLKSLEHLGGQVDDSLRGVITDVVRAVRFQANTMEKQDLYAYATLFDPRFKARYFSMDVVNVLKMNVKEACVAESRHRDMRYGKRGEGVNHGGSNSNALEHYMESIIPELSVSPSGLSTYLAEPTSERDDDIDEYWNRNQGRWPVLAKAAARYSVIPCSCGTEGISKSLLGCSQRKGGEFDLSGRDIAAISAMEFVRMNTV